MKRIDIRSQQTAQLLSLRKPLLKEASLTLHLICPICRTVRGFRLGHTLNMLQGGDSRAIKYASYCEECGQLFEVTLGMSDTTIRGWTRRDPYGEGDPAHGVVDGAGMAMPDADPTKS